MTTTTRTGIIAFIIALVIVVYAIVHIHKSDEPGAQNTAGTTVSYACNAGKSISATFYDGGSASSTPDGRPVPTGSAQVQLSDGRSLTLAQTISADGARYANSDDTFVFWSKGNGALVLEHTQEKSYIGCIRVAAQPQGSNLSQTYANKSDGFSILLPSIVASTSQGHPDSYKVDESYSYQLNPTSTIYGVKFMIPTSIADGTNLSQDSYISVETLPVTSTCRADFFLDGNHISQDRTEDGVTYSIASSTGAGAGNRYEETVYAIPGTNPCVAVRYFVHYSVLQNYPAGTVKEFDSQGLISQFDAIRGTLVVAK